MSNCPLYYDDICLIPNNYSELMSRKEADTTVDFLGKKYRNPVILSNMKSLVDEDICMNLALNGYFYIMHRFGSPKGYVFDKTLSVTQNFIKIANQERLGLVSISTGVNIDSYNDLKWIIDSVYSINVITLDIALAFHKKAEQMIRFIKKELPDVKIIAGNVAERKGVAFLGELGVDAIKLGIGQGCFVGDTQILMANGMYKSIKDIDIGDYVINSSGNPVKVINKTNNGFKKLLKLKCNTWYDYTYVTPDHNYWIGDLGTSKIEGNCINTGIAKQLDKLSKSVPKQSKYKWKPIGSLNKINNFLLLPKKYNFILPDDYIIDLANFVLKGDISEDLIKTEIEFNRYLKSDYDLGYIIGTFLGDGTSKVCRVKNKKGYFTEIGAVSWVFSKNEIDIAEKLGVCLEKQLGYKAKIKYRKNTILVIVYNKCLAKMFLPFNKRFNKNLPQEFYCSNKKYITGLYDGLLDSDGTYSDKISFANTSSHLHKVFYFCCQNLEKSFGTSISFDDTSKLVQKARIAYITRIHRSNRFTENFLCSTLNTSEYLASEQETWDIEVDCPTHSFIANNAIVHNSVCSTKLQTGFTAPMLWSLSQASGEAKRRNIPLIADGGIKHIGDIAKALVFGATMVMSGALFAGCIDSAAKLNREGKKEYYGSASFNCKQSNKNVEGISVGLEPYNSILEKLEEVNQALSSSISYAGGKDLSAFNDVEWLQIS